MIRRLLHRLLFRRYRPPEAEHPPPICRPHARARHAELVDLADADAVADWLRPKHDPPRRPGIGGVPWWYRD
jgi:hypothetical protein